MPPESDLAQAYAHALLALCEAADVTATVERQLGDLLEFLNKHEAIGRFAGDPTITGDGKREALDQLLTQDLHAVLMHFVLILLACGLFRELPSVAQAFSHTLAEKREHSTGELVSAHPVSDAKVALIEKEVSRILGKNVHLQARVDTGMLGGLIVRVGDFVIDGTIDHQLDAVRRNLLAEPGTLPA